MHEKVTNKNIEQPESTEKRKMVFPPLDNQVVNNTTHGINMSGKNSAVVQPMPAYPASVTQQDSSFQPGQNKNRELPFPYMYHHNVPSTMTYLSPSQNVRPLMTPYVTPNVVKPISVIKRASPRSDGETDKSADEDELIDVVNDSSRSSDASKSDISMSTQSSVSDSSPSSGSQGSISPVSNGAATPEQNESTKKKARTNYSPDQVQALEKVFHENPYPDPEMMENLSKDLNIPEGKIKVWFQNKRARWRKRVQGNTMGYQAPFISSVPSFMPPLSPMGFLPGNHMMGGASSPVPGHFMPFPQPPPSPVSPNNANKLSPSPISSPFQQRPQLPPYFYSYPYGMYPPYFC